MFWHKKKTKQSKENSNKSLINGPEANSTPIIKKKSNDIISSLPELDNFKKTEIFKGYHKKKKELLPTGAMTREEITKEIETLLSRQSSDLNNPFKNSPDMYFYFFNSNMQLNRPAVAFEEVKIGGKIFYINKRFENGAIIIDDIIGSPDVEINIQDEYAKKETTKKQLELLNRYILHIRNKIANGDQKYKLLDIEDLKEEKWRLEKILESIKYGKISTFVFEDPISHKKSFWLKYKNGEYNYLKITENNFITEENNIKFLKGYEIQKRLEEVVNLRISTNWKQIIFVIAILVMVTIFLMVMFKMMTFEEDLFDKRVKGYCGDQKEYYENQIEYYSKQICTVDRTKPTFNEQI